MLLFHVLEVISVCPCTNFCIQWHHVGNLELTMLGKFTPHKSVDVTNQGSPTLHISMKNQSKDGVSMTGAQILCFSSYMLFPVLIDEVFKGSMQNVMFIVNFHCFKYHVINSLHNIRMLSLLKIANSYKCPGKKTKLPNCFSSIKSYFYPHRQPINNLVWIFHTLLIQIFSEWINKRFIQIHGL